MEYGVHWNFFFTLAGVSILTSVINVPSRYCGLLGFFVLVGKIHISHLQFFYILLKKIIGFFVDIELNYYVM